MEKRKGDKRKNKTNHFIMSSGSRTYHSFTAFIACHFLTNKQANKHKMGRGGGGGGERKGKKKKKKETAQNNSKPTTVRTVHFIRHNALRKQKR